MTKQQRMNALEAEKIVLSNGFVHVRTKGSHRIYMKDSIRIVIPFHSGNTLHSKIIKQILLSVNSSKGI